MKKCCQQNKIPMHSYYCSMPKPLKCPHLCSDLWFTATHHPLFHSLIITKTTQTLITLRSCVRWGEHVQWPQHSLHYPIHPSPIQVGCPHTHGLFLPHSSPTFRSHISLFSLPYSIQWDQQGTRTAMWSSWKKSITYVAIWTNNPAVNNKERAQKWYYIYSRVGLSHRLGPH